MNWTSERVYCACFGSEMWMQFHFELYKLSTIFIFAFMFFACLLADTHTLTGLKGASAWMWRCACVRERARILQIIICLLKDSLIEIAWWWTPNQFKNKPKPKSKAVCVCKCMRHVEVSNISRDLERHTKLMLTKYTMHVISLMTKCSNCIGKSQNKRAVLQLRTHTCVCM